MAPRNRRFLDFLLYSNLFIGCCAAAQAAVVAELLSFPWQPDVMLLVGLSTMVLYSIPQALAGRTAQGNAKLRWSSRNRTLLLLLLGLAVLGMIVMLARLRTAVITGYVFAGVLALAYYAPVIGRKGHREGLRSLYGAKVFYIALVWVLACWGLPLLVAFARGWTVNAAQAFQLAGWMFLFLVAITIPFDIRDQRTDQKHGLRTLPVLIGVRPSQWASTLLLVIHCIGVLASGYGMCVRVLLLAVSAWAVGLVWQAKHRKGDYYYFLALDGLLILQYVAVLVGGLIRC